MPKIFKYSLFAFIALSLFAYLMLLHESNLFPSGVIPLQESQETVIATQNEEMTTKKLPEKHPTRKFYTKGHVMPPKTVCPNEGATMKMMILVMTTPGHADQRRAIRMTWAHYSSRVDVGLAFFVGTSREANDKKIIEDENLVYGDVIQGHFIDTYKNLTLKTISMLEWTAAHCNRTRFLLKVDEDVFVNIPVLLRLLDNPMYQNNAIVGRVGKKEKPVRNTKSKYYVSKEDYADEYYPNFTHGPAYLVSSDVIEPLYDAALDGEFFWLEDVYITGVTADKLNVTRRHSDALYNRRPNLDKTCDVKKHATIHSVKPVEMFSLWTRFSDGNVKCT